VVLKVVHSDPADPITAAAVVEFIVYFESYCGRAGGKSEKSRRGLLLVLVVIVVRWN
jgi:hypothetical protein